MKTQELEKQIEKTRNFLVIVEGIKDKRALLQLGFHNIFVINETGKSLREKIEEVSDIALKNKKIKICILTDFDKRGKKLYLELKKELSTRGCKLDSSLRQSLLKSDVSHIEGLSSFMDKN